MRNVLAVRFHDDSKAYEALTTLKDLDAQNEVELTGAAIVVRQADGRVVVKDSAGDTGLEGTATGGMIGLLIGIIGGPLGVLLGGATGLLIGSLFDMDDEDETDSVLSAVSRSARVGRTALLAEVTEPSPEVDPSPNIVDRAMADLGGTVQRQTVDEVTSEIAAAKEAQRRAKREARRHLHEERRAHLSEDAHAKVTALKAKLHHNRSVAGEGAASAGTAR